jgi:O-antigen/teichoic acid export membrane protein
MNFTGNLAWKLFSSLGAGGLHFLFSLLVMRYLGPSDFGKYTFAMGWGGLFCLFVDYGFNSVVVRDIPPKPGLGRAYFRHVVRGKGFLVIGAGAFMLAVSVLHPRASELWMPALLAFLFLSASSMVEVCQAFTAAYEKFQAGAFLTFAHKGAVIGFGVLALLFHWGLVPLLALVAFGGCVGAAVCLAYFRSFLRDVRYSQDALSSSGSLWKAGLPIFIQTLVTVIYFRIDSVMMSWLRGDHDTGIYGAAYRFFDVANVIPSALVAVLVARLSREVSRSDWENSFWKALRYFILAGIGGVAVLQAVAWFLPGYFLTDEFLASQRLLQVLSFDLLFLYPNYLLVTLLTLLHRQGTNVWIAAGCVVFNISANLIAIPRWGPMGAVATTMMTDALYFVSALVVVYRCRKTAVAAAP